MIPLPPLHVGVFCPPWKLTEPLHHTNIFLVWTWCDQHTWYLLTSRKSLQLLLISHSDWLICRHRSESTPRCASQCVTRAELQCFNLSKWLLPRLHHCKCQCVCFAGKRLYFGLDICSNGTNEVVFLWVNVQLCGRFARCRILVAAVSCCKKKVSIQSLAGAQVHLTAWTPTYRDKCPH